MSTHRFLARASALGAAAALVTMLGTGTADAHVTAKVLGEAAQQGGYTKITFRVPNEEENAGTVKLEVTLPPQYALSSVRTKPIPGWTAQLTKTKLDQPVKSGNTEVTDAYTSITWTAAAGTRISPGEFGEFEVSAGKLPETAQLVLPTTQTYDDGTVVKWDAPPAAEGAGEPEHPAPVVALTAKGAGDEHDHAAAATDTHTDTTAAAASGDDNTARWLGGAGLVVGALGLGLGAGATVRARKSVNAAKAAQ